MNQDQLNRLSQYLTEFRLKGEWWVLGADEAFQKRLECSAPEQKVRGKPLVGQADLVACSILLIDSASGEGGSTDLVEDLFSRRETHPLVVLMPEAQDEPLRRQLEVLGYLDPELVDCEGVTVEIFQHAELDYKRHFDVAGYWEQRYRSGRNSGAGSYGRLARFKARFLNRFVKEFGVQSVIELGCGDGAQLALAEYPRYHGLDISSTVVAECESRFADDVKKSFSVYQPEAFDLDANKADLALSLDVIYHLSNDEVYRSYLRDLFGSAKRFVVIYSNSDTAKLAGVDESAGYVRFRNFLTDVESWHPDWQLISATPNRFPYSALKPAETSFADFYVFAASGECRHKASDSHKLLDRMALWKVLNSITITDENLLEQKQEIARNYKEQKKQSAEQFDQMQRLESHLKELEHREAASATNADHSLQCIGSKLDLISSSLRTEDDARKQDSEFQRESLLRLEERIDCLESQTARLNEVLGKERSRALAATEERMLQALSQMLEAGRSDVAQNSEMLRKALATAELALEQASVQSANHQTRVMMLEESMSYQIGNAIVDAVKYPGFNTLRLPVRLVRLLRRKPRDYRDKQRAARQQSQDALQEVRSAIVESRRSQGTPWHFHVGVSNKASWYSIKVPRGAAVNVVTQLTRKGSAQTPGREVVLLVECRNDQGKRIQGAFAQMPYSERLKSYFKYVPESDQPVNIMAFEPPAGTSEILIGVRNFCPGPDARYTLSRLAITAGAGTWAEPVFLATTHSDTSQGMFNPPSRDVQELSIRGWPAPDGGSKPIVLGVMDEFTETCFGPNVGLLKPRPDNWYALAQKYPPEMVFVESAWKGNGGSWQYRVGSYNYSPGDEVSQMFQWARKQGIPSIFWNKEDPVHHDKFMAAAGRAEHIFTTDQKMVESYKQQTGNASVHALPFAAQPALHKPAALGGRVAACCFAGSWYGDRHAARGEAMKWLLDAALPFDLHIYDRNHGTGNFEFPGRFRDCIRGGLPYRELCHQYRQYRVFLNVNSVTDSPTMLSRRVFELLASGTPVISTPALGIESVFDEQAVWLVETPAQAREATDTLLNDDKEWRRRSLAGIREVFSRHTYAHRINQIFEIVGISQRKEVDPRVLVLATVDSDQMVDELVHFVDQQSYQNFVVGVSSHDEYRLPENLPEKLLRIESPEMFEVLVNQQRVGVVGDWSLNLEYGQHYLRDLVNAMAYAPDAQGWGKSLEVDVFGFGATSHSSASFWLPEAYRSYKRRVKSGEGEVASADLFVIDASEIRRRAENMRISNGQADDRS